MTIKQKPIPSEVPWMVAPSTPYLRLHVIENSVATVQFAALFLDPDDSATLDEKWAGDAILVAKAPLVSDNEDITLAPYREVKVTFTVAAWVRVSPAVSELEVVREAEYDWSAIPWRTMTGQDIDEWNRYFSTEWRRTSRCPDPGMYEILYSAWLQDVGARGLKHFLVIGEDSYIEVLAESWSYEVLGAIEGW